MHLHSCQDVIVFRGQLEGREGWLPDGLWRYFADTLEEGSPVLQNPSVPFHLISSSDIDRVLHQVCEND